MSRESAKLRRSTGEKGDCFRLVTLAASVDFAVSNLGDGSGILRSKWPFRFSLRVWDIPPGSRWTYRTCYASIIKAPMSLQSAAIRVALRFFDRGGLSGRSGSNAHFRMVGEGAGLRNLRWLPAKATRRQGRYVEGYPWKGAPKSFVAFPHPPGDLYAASSGSIVEGIRVRNPSAPRLRLIR